MDSFCPYSTFTVLSVYLEVSVVWGICFCYMALGLFKTTAPRRGVRVHFRFIFLINNCAISKGRQDDKIFASFHNGFPDENLLWFSSHTWAYLCWGYWLWKAHHTKWMFPSRTPPLDCGTTTSTCSLCLYPQRVYLSGVSVQQHSCTE